MGIIETKYVCNTIVSAICCTLKKDKNVEDIKIKIDETNIDKTEDTNFNHEELSNSSDVIKSINELKEIIMKNMIGPCTSNHMFVEQCKQRQQNSVIKDKSQMTIVTNKHCCCSLSDLHESHKHNIRVLYPCLLVSNSTKNSQSNCSIDNANISTSYILYRGNEENNQDMTYENRTYPLTSTDMNSKRKRSLRKFTAAIFRPFFQ